jgi:hypothetical protein
MTRLKAIPSRETVMKMEAEISYELSVCLYKTARWYSVKDCDLNTYQPNEKAEVLSGSSVPLTDLHVVTHQKGVTLLIKYKTSPRIG